VIHETKRDITITISEWLVQQFIFDLEYQLEIIIANGDDGDSSMKPVFQRALAKFQAVLQ
jgi:hypothetical protein